MKAVCLLIYFVVEVLAAYLFGWKALALVIAGSCAMAMVVMKENTEYIYEEKEDCEELKETENERS